MDIIQKTATKIYYLMNKQYKIIIAGDLLPSEANVGHYENGNIDILFDQKIQDFFKNADYSIVNLEGALTDSEKKQEKIGPSLKASKRSVRGIKMLGVKCVALANNHITDYLQQGVKDTIDVLDESAIQHVGCGLSKDSINTHISIALGDVRVCIYNVSESFFNIPSDCSAGVNIYDEYLVCNEIKTLKETHDYLIVIYHGGTEFFQYPTPLVRKRFRRMADCGADFITSQHTHCIGCEELYNDCYFLYGQGNFFLDRMKRNIARQGLLTEIIISKDEFYIRNHQVCIDAGKLVYDSDQEQKSFFDRSKEISNDENIRKLYNDFIRNNVDLKRKYYQAYKGHFWGRKVLSKLFPNHFLHHIENSYDNIHLSRIVFSLESDRMREDVCCLWEQVKKR